MSWLNAGLSAGIPSRGSYEEDNLEDDVVERSYHLNIDSDKCSGSLQILIITTTNLAKNFVEVYITPKDNNGTVIGQITEKEHLPNVSNDINSENIKTKVVAKLYQISDDVIHCNVDQIQADDLNNFIDALFNADLIQVSKSIKVAILSSDHVTNFQCNAYLNTDDVPIKRCLIVSPNQESITQPCERLEQPNVVNGVPASVLTECKFRNIPCLLLVSFVDSHSPDSITLSGFMPLFKVSEFSNVKKTSKDTSNERLKSLYSKPKKTENIFM